jgi:small subunit ribosomal protein S17
MPKRILTGTVTSDANEQTVTVSVERRFTHPILKKTIRKSKKYRAHDENNTFKVGQQVRIIECPPRSKTKRWEVIIAEA